MTLLDLFTGHWTAGQLLREIVPILFCAAGAFYGGYCKGRVDEQSYWIVRAQKADEQIAALIGYKEGA